MFFRARDHFLPVEIEKVHRERCKFRESGVEQAYRAAKRAPLDVVIGGGELNQALEKSFLAALRNEPHPLPRFVRVPEALFVEEGDAFREIVQSVARVPFFRTPQIAAVKSMVVPVPPMSRVRSSGPMPRTFTIASSMRFAGPVSPM